MAFKRIQVPVRTVNAASEVSYRVQPARKGLCNARFCLTIRPDVAKKAGLLAGTPVEIEADAKTGHGRLLRVMRAHRKITRTSAQHGNSRLMFSAPHVGELVSLFPANDRVSALIFLEATEDNGLIFELPTKAEE